MTFASADVHADLNRLASGWMESGIALLEGGAPEVLDDAIRCFDEAIELRRRLPFAEDPGFRYGLAAGWINRGDALTRLGGPSNLADAVQSYTEAIDLLKAPPAGDDGSFVRRLAIAGMNRGIALEEEKSAPSQADAIHSYKQAIRLLSGRATTPAASSTWFLRARGSTLATPCSARPGERLRRKHAELRNRR